MDDFAPLVSYRQACIRMNKRIGVRERLLIDSLVLLF